MLPSSSSPQVQETVSTKQPLSDSQKKRAALARHKLPPHWQAPNGEGVLGFIKISTFRILCICAYGEPHLDFVWASIKLADEGDETVWDNSQKRLSEQQSNVLVLAGLLLATLSVFISTPAPVSKFLDYTRRGPYLCLFLAFGLLIGGMIVAAVCILVTNRISSTYTSKVLFRSTLHVYITLSVISYSLLCTTAAIELLAFGILTGAWSTDDLVFQLSAVVVVLLPHCLGILFAVSVSSYKIASHSEQIRDDLFHNTE